VPQPSFQRSPVFTSSSSAATVAFSPRIRASSSSPATYDLALIANICHLFGENANLQLLRRVADALRPAGRVAIVDILPTERGDGPRPAVLYALGLVLRTSSGRIYPYSTFRRWLGQGGFEDPRRRDLPGPFPFTLITATRR
jgi:hypothetical protein